MTLKNDTMLSGGKYRIVRFISAGGFGCTYEAVHTLMNTRVAIKEFFPKDFCNRDENTSQISVGTKSQVELVARLKKQFLREAKVLFDMKHPSVVRVIDFFEENGTAYYVMDYIDGPSLEQILKENGPMPEPKALKYVSQICDALGYVHSQGKVHLDLKPNNVMIDSPDGRAVLIDFGTSKQYSTDGGVTSTMMGLTPGYAPPEQCSNDIKDLGAASDIYALGATLYRMLTGNTPVDSLSRSAGTQLLPLPPTVSPSVAMAIERAMTLNRNLRPQSAEEFMQIAFNEVSQTPPSVVDNVPLPVNDSKPTHIVNSGAGGGYGGITGGYDGHNHYALKKKGLSKAAIVGISIGAVLLVLYVVGIIIGLTDYNETAEKLNGKWEVTSGVTGVGTDGTTMTFAFDNSDMTGSMELDIKTEGIDIMTMSVPFTWDCNPSEITFNMDANNTSFEFSDTFKTMTESTGQSIETMKVQIKDELLKSLPKLGRHTIKELTEDKLIMNADKETITCKRIL